MQTREGIYAFACLEGARPWFIDVQPAGSAPRPKFAAAIAPQTLLRFPTVDGKCELLLGVRADFTDWDMPAKSRDQMHRANTFWGGAFL